VVLRLSISIRWCQHFEAPLLQLSGQSDAVRRQVLGRIWAEGVCWQPAQSDGAEDGGAAAAVGAGGAVDEVGHRRSEGGRSALKGPSCRGLGL